MDTLTYESDQPTIFEDNEVRANGASKTMTNKKPTYDDIVAQRQQLADTTEVVIADELSRLEEVLIQRDQILANLELLGYKSAKPTVNPAAIELPSQGAKRGRKPNPVKVAGKKRGITEADATCPVCEIRGHSLRKHRYQGKKKKKFTQEQLRKIAAGEKLH